MLLSGYQCGQLLAVFFCLPELKVQELLLQGKDCGEARSLLHVAGGTASEGFRRLLMRLTGTQQRLLHQLLTADTCLAQGMCDCSICYRLNDSLSIM